MRSCAGLKPSPPAAAQTGGDGRFPLKCRLSFVVACVHASVPAESQDPPRHRHPPELNYEGSIAIDGLLLEATGIREFEQVHIWDVTNGARFSTYAIRAEDGSGIMSLNGGAARHVQVGDLIIVAAFASMSEDEAKTFKPNLVYVNAHNAISHTNHSIPTQAA